MSINNKILSDKIAEVVDLLTREVLEKVQAEFYNSQSLRKDKSAKSLEISLENSQADFELLDVDDVAQLLKVKKRTIYEWVRTKKIPFKHVGDLLRFNRAEILEWLEKQ